MGDADARAGARRPRPGAASARSARPGAPRRPAATCGKAASTPDLVARAPQPARDRPRHPEALDRDHPARVGLVEAHRPGRAGLVHREPPPRVRRQQGVRRRGCSGCAAVSRPPPAAVPGRGRLALRSPSRRCRSRTRPAPRRSRGRFDDSIRASMRSWRAASWAASRSMASPRASRSGRSMIASVRTSRSSATSCARIGPRPGDVEPPVGVPGAHEVLDGDAGLQAPPHHGDEHRDLPIDSAEPRTLAGAVPTAPRCPRRG